MYQICLHFSHESSVCEWTLPKQYSPSIHLDSKGSFLTEVVICSIKPIINEVEPVDEVKT